MIEIFFDHCSIMINYGMNAKIEYSNPEKTLEVEDLEQEGQDAE